MIKKCVYENMWEIKNDTKVKIDYLKSAKIIDPKKLEIDMIRLYLEPDETDKRSPFRVDNYKLKKPIKFKEFDDCIWKADVYLEVKYNNENQDVKAICSYTSANIFKLVSCIADNKFDKYFYKSFSVRICENN